jgi:hypothetical protein
VSLDAVAWGFLVSAGLAIFAAGLVTGCAIAAAHELRIEAARAAHRGRVGGGAHVVIVDPGGPGRLERTETGARAAGVGGDAA